MIIAVDAVGGDFYPKNPVEGALLALAENKLLKIVLVGPAVLIRAELNNHSYDPERVSILDASEIVTMKDVASTAVKAKKNSSITVGLTHHKEQNSDAFVSAGNTGALLAASTLILGKLKGVIRPTIATYFPTMKGFRLMVDAGANLEIKPQMAIQFAKMAQIYTHHIMGVAQPKVGLLNVGEEEGKGTPNLKSIFNQLQELQEFVGNVEGRDILPAKADVFVTDGVVGNILLKYGESIPKALKQMIKNSAKGGIKSKLEIWLAQKILKASLAPFNYENVGGLPFLGVNGVSFVGHGGSSALAIKNMINAAIECVRHNINDKIVVSLN